jgi:chromosome segregation ATPase
MASRDPCAPSGIAAWHHEQLDGRLFLYLDCDREVALKVVTKLRQNGLLIEVWGPARKPARSGRLYQHYLQIARTSADGNVPDLGEVLDAAEELRALQPQPDELGKLRAQVEEAKRDSAGLADRLREAKAVIRDLEVQLENGKMLERRWREAAQEVSRLRGDNESLRSQLSLALSRATAQEAVRGRLQQLEGQNASLQKRITDQAKEFGEAYEWAERADNECKRLQREKAELEDRVARLRESAEKLGEAEAPDTAEVIRGLLPKVEMLPESLGYIFRGIRDRGPVLDLLARLNQDCEQIRHKTTKRVESATGWMERHFSTGQGDEGRLYYSKPDPTGRRRVLVAPKGDQKLSIQRLQSFPVQ